MRHRQSSGAGPIGSRSSLAVSALTVAALIVALAVQRPAGLWAAYAVATAAALVGAGTLWGQRGQVEHRSKEMARRRRADLDRAAVAEHKHRGDTDRLRAELEHEQQYSALVQTQLGRARRQLEDERIARRAAERELDALGAWKAAVQSAIAPGDPDSVSVVDLPVPPLSASPRLVVPQAASPHPADARNEDEAEDQDFSDDEADDFYYSAYDVDLPQFDPRVPALPGSAPRSAQAALRGNSRPERRSVVPSSVSEAALAMAPVIGHADEDDVLDLTAYDETVEFSIRDFRLRRMA